MTTALDSVNNPVADGSGRERKLSAGSDLPYRAVLAVVTVVVSAVLALFVYSIVASSIPGWKAAGWHFFTGTDWNYGNGTFGAFPLLIGTLLTTGLALILAVPIGISSALAIVFLIPRRLRTFVSSVVELLAVVPSVIYGVWGYLVIAHWLDSKGQPWLQRLTSGHFPFSGNYTGFGLMLGAIVLAVMILPTITAISRDVFAAVPNEIIEGALSLGATKGQILRRVVLRSTRSGQLGAVTLGTGRALGETIAMVLLLTGLNQLHPIPSGLFATTATFATEIASNFGSSTGAAAIGILSCLALVLMVIVGAVTLGARVIVSRSMRKFA